MANIDYTTQKEWSDMGWRINLLARASENNGNTILNTFSNKGIVDKNRDINTTDMAGRTAAHLAAKALVDVANDTQHGTTAIQALVKLGANINAVDGNGDTPLLTLVKNAPSDGSRFMDLEDLDPLPGDIQEVVDALNKNLRLMQKLGADFSAKDKDGKTAADILKDRQLISNIDAIAKIKTGTPGLPPR